MTSHSSRTGDVDDPVDLSRPGRLSRLLDLSIVGVIAGFVGSLIVALIGADAVKDSDIRTARAETYASYVEAHAEFNEFVWAHVDWAGSDATGDQPGDLSAQFWPDAARLQAHLSAANVQARFLADGGEVETLLIALHQDQTEAFLRFKCMAGIQEPCPPLSDGEVIVQATNAEIRLMLDRWSSESATNVDELIEAVADQLT